VSDFENEPHESEHPEISSDPETMLPVSQATKGTLVETVKGKLGSQTSRLYEIDDDEFDTLSMSWDETGHTITQPLVGYNAIGGVTLFDRGGDNDRGETSYWFRKAPDGIQLEKFTGALPDAQTLKDMTKPLANLEHRVAVDSERELGLTFVSEAEARRVLGLANGAQRELPL